MSSLGCLNNTMKLYLQQLSVQGTARMKYLAPDAASALLDVEKDLGALSYADMWRDAADSLIARRSRKGSQLPGYTPHGYGLAIDIDASQVLGEKKVRYADLTHYMEKHGWHCHRRDEEPGKQESDHFNFLGPLANKYLVKTTLDPATWQNAADLRIVEKFGEHFQLDPSRVQELLASLGFHTGPRTAQLDMYTRETISAFQRAWGLREDGTASMTLCRSLAFIAAERQFRPTG